MNGLRDLGYVYGENFRIEPRSAENRPERYSTLASELVRLRVDVIVAGGPPLLAIKQATTTIPVVMVGAGDAVRLGLAQSLARPGGNFTGLSLQHSELAAKRLQLLKELVPGASRVAVLWHRASAFQWEETQAAAAVLGRQLQSLEIRDTSDIERAFGAIADSRAGALLVIPGAVVDGEAKRIAELAARRRLPAMYGLKRFVVVGGLISYGVDIDDIVRRVPVYIDMILKGAKPLDLPIEQPTRFELVIKRGPRRR